MPFVVALRMLINQRLQNYTTVTVWQ